MKNSVILKKAKVLSQSPLALGLWISYPVVFPPCHPHSRDQGCSEAGPALTELSIVAVASYLTFGPYERPPLYSEVHFYNNVHFVP